MKVVNFVYNGFSVNMNSGLAPYTAKFEKYLEGDMGIAVCKCSDGKTRSIPTCALICALVGELPKQELDPAVKKSVALAGGYIGKNSHS